MRVSVNLWVDEGEGPLSGSDDDSMTAGRGVGSRVPFVAVSSASCTQNEIRQNGQPVYTFSTSTNIRSELLFTLTDTKALSLTNQANNCAVRAFGT